MTTKQKAGEIAKELAKLYPNAQIELNFKAPLELVVAVILSAQSTDKQVNIITEKLFKQYKTVDDYVHTPLEKFQDDIRNIGLYKGKAKNIKALMQILKEKYNGEIPKTMNELIALPGIGRKTANIILGNVFNIIEGIAVDTHVTRLSQLFGLTLQKDPVKIERDLMELLPQSEWFAFSKRLILYGRYICTAHCKHEDCALRKYIN